MNVFALCGTASECHPVATALYRRANHHYGDRAQSLQPGAALAARKNRVYTRPVRAAWKKFRYRIEWLLVKAGGAIVPLLSRRACFRLAQFVGGLAATVDQRNFRVALSNLEAAFGETFSQAQRHEIARESYRQFARTVFDLFWTPAL